MRRVEDDEVEGVIWEWEVGEVGDEVWGDGEGSGSAIGGGVWELVGFVAIVYEDGSWVEAIEPEHAATAAGVEDWRECLGFGGGDHD